MLLHITKTIVYIFLSQAQLKLKETTDSYSPTIKQEMTQIQKSYTEELNSKRSNVAKTSESHSRCEL